jgi:hypothetical protein
VKILLPCWHREIQSGVILTGEVVGVEELTENVCGQVTGTIQRPRGRGMSTVGTCYQRVGEDS